MSRFHELLSHHVTRLRVNRGNLYAAGAVDALLGLLDDTESDALFAALVAGEAEPISVRLPDLG